MFPTINIAYNRFLDPIFLEYCKHHPKWKDWVPFSKEEVLARVEKYKEIWQKHEQVILTGICDFTGLNFKRNVIDVYVVTGNPRSFSRPLVLRSGYSEGEFIINLTHELIHALLSDNEEIGTGKLLLDRFPEESPLTRNHIIVNAVLKYVYLDILKNEKLLERNLFLSKSHGSIDYVRAWEIVEELGYKNVVPEFIKP